MNDVTRSLLEQISEFGASFRGAYNIREDGGCAARQSTEHIKIEDKEGAPGLVVRIAPGTKGETVAVPACVTHGGVQDLVYNDFYVGEGADVVISAGCGIHTDGSSCGESLHHGIHRFFLAKGAHVLYKENHVGTGGGAAVRRIDPVTDAVREEDAVLEMDTAQIGGVTRSVRKTTATLAARAKLIVRERLMTDGSEVADTDFLVKLNGEDSGANIISRSVARDDSRQSYRSRIEGNARCSGHSECDAILVGNGVVSAAPELLAADVDAALIHEAAIGKIAGEQILKLRTFGLTEEEAEQQIIDGFLNA